MTRAEAVKKVWSFPEGKKRIIMANALGTGTIGKVAKFLLTSSLTRYGHREYYVLPGGGDTAALYYVRPTLFTLFPPKDFSLDFGDDVKFEDYKDDNLILIGGPRSNPVTADALIKLEGKLQHKISKGMDNIDLLSGEQLTSLIERRHVTLDCGFILKHPSPFNPKKLLFVLAGTRTYATAACGAVLEYDPVLFSIVDHIGEEPFEIVFAAHLENHSPSVTAIEVKDPDFLNGIRIDSPFNKLGLPKEAAEWYVVSRELPGVESERRIPDNLRKEAIDRSGGVCSLCGRGGIPLEVDHIVPVDRGGVDRLDNLRVVCRSCHIQAHKSNLKIDAIRDQARGGYELEQMVVETFQKAGYAVISGATGPDAGIDVIAHGIEKTTGQPYSVLIECKYAPTKIPVEAISAFAAKLHNYQSRYGIIVSNVEVSPDAGRIADSFGLRVVSAHELDELVHEISD